MIIKKVKYLPLIALSSLLLFGCSNSDNVSKSDLANSDSNLIEESTSNDYIKFSSLTSLLESSVASENYLNDYNLNWWNYKTTDGSLLLSDKKGSFYTNNNSVDYFGVSIGDNITSLKNLLGEPLEHYKKDNNLYEIKSEKYYSYKIEGNYVTYFIDTLNNNVVRNVLIIPVNTENLKEGYYSNNDTSDTYISSLENLMVELINSDRRSNGLKELVYDRTLNLTARNHSKDMIDNNYFAHDNLEGESVKDRMVADGFTDLSLYGENLAYGQFNAIYAHEELMNSEGHRKNILEERYSHVGVGVAINSDNLPYFTINFYSE